MPRKARLEMPGDIHHVMSRGIDSENIFRSDSDREWFVAKLGSVLTTTQCRCYAWVLMNNHYHLLLRPGAQPLAKTMRKLNAAYAQYYNRTHHRKGYLFQDRYKSIPTRDIGYIKELICYIHLNPVRAGIIKKPGDLNLYNWSGHSVLIGRLQFPWMHSNETLLRFGRSLQQGREKYLAVLSEMIQREQRSSATFNAWHGDIDNKHIAAIAPDGSSSERDPVFVRKAVKEYHMKLQRCKHLLENGWNIDRVVNRVLALFDLKQENIMSNTKKRDVVNARALIYYWATEELGMSFISVARYFGQTCSTAIRSVEKGKRLAIEQGIKLTQ